MSGEPLIIVRALSPLFPSKMLFDHKLSAAKRDLLTEMF
jgi:hypothetical protein